MIRLGLCCVFHDTPIKFKNTTATHAAKLTKKVRLEKLAGLCRHNAMTLAKAIEFCAASGIGSFRINSQILPLKTHPDLGYDIKDLPSSDEILGLFRGCGQLAAENNIRLTFHPDQFVVFNSPRPEVVRSSIKELEYQAEVAEWVGADVINIHGGGAYGVKRVALSFLEMNLNKLSERVRRRLTLENDDKIYTPDDLLPLCRKNGLPLVYDIHHHRCNPDRLSGEEATQQALKTWNREPLFHISSPLEGWRGGKPARHHDYINIKDFPTFWFGFDLTVEVEAKAKEKAIKKLRRELMKKAPESSIVI
ncbi:MAG: UV DNA damage repair endonuclease UvsE [Candidatus Zixiibacteriota bacterium]